MRVNRQSREGDGVNVLCGSTRPGTNPEQPCHAPIPLPRRTMGVRDCTGTLYFLFQTLVGSSLIIESKYHIKMIQNKTTTVVVFTVSIHTVLSPIYIYIYKKIVHLRLHNQSAEPTSDRPL